MSLLRLHFNEMLLFNLNCDLLRTSMQCFKFETPVLQKSTSTLIQGFSTGGSRGHLLRYVPQKPVLQYYYSRIWVANHQTLRTTALIDRFMFDPLIHTYVFTSIRLSKIWKLLIFNCFHTKISQLSSGEMFIFRVWRELFKCVSGCNFLHWYIKNIKTSSSTTITTKPL